ncbi:hypothetical protein GCM10023080_040040 [Streptomyces pseudoechinosporeus]
MAHPSGLRPQDRADFEAVLHLALNTPDILSALRADPTGRAATRLRLRALAHHRLQERLSAHRLAAVPVRTAEQTLPDSSIKQRQTRRKSTPCRST